MPTSLYNIRYLIGALVLAITAGCATSPASYNTLKAPQNQYQAHIVDPQSDTLNTLTPEQLAKRLANANVVVIGEYHGHHASHLLQAQLQLALFQQQPQQILSMEQFETDQQNALNQYLAGSSGESEMIEDTGAWDNYRASYRPIVEFALSHQLPVIAANAPGAIVRCVGREGPHIIDDLSQAQRQTIAQQPFMDTPAYRQRFDDAIGASHGGDDDAMKQRLDNSYKAQLLRDNTMAERILQARRNYPGHQILHVNGNFHSEQRQGTVALLHKRAPALNIAVISPVFWPEDEAMPELSEHRTKGDFLYFLQPLPDAYKSDDRRNRAMRERFSQAGQQPCN
ncbi:ChaN family lipoprotein [Marinobacter gelidimuriae]|uniref:ChaN family lipoprotein n=1 Tax=Marinobacter gelidimuriae TaxID=2739064 RepID=UPI000369F672|nr:ChaN family lipoprotein [Marinobacter gelidimuriae]